jgi:hypothetical protein
MTVIGVLLILLAVVLLLIGLLAGADTGTTLSLGGVDISMSAMGVFLMGAATVLIFVSGLELFRSGLRRSLRRRRELKEARAVVAEQERRERDTGPEPTTAGTTGSTGETAATTNAPGATPGATTNAPGARPGATPGAGDEPGRHAH